MTAVDEGIHQNSDRIAQKVLQIQQKLESALAERRVGRTRPSLESENDSENGKGRGSPAPINLYKGRESYESRTRSNTASSTQTSARTTKTATHYSPTLKRDRSMTPKAPASPTIASRISSGDENFIPIPTSPSNLSPSTASYAPSTPAVTNATTEDSDTDFQSAYSTSPRESYYDSENGGIADGSPTDPSEKMGVFFKDELREIPSIDSDEPHMSKGMRNRASSAATTIAPSTHRLASSV